jgi:hypothetical protein
MASIRLSDVSRFVDGMQREMVAAAQAGLLNAAARGLQTLVTQIIPSRSPQPVDRGVYRAGWKMEQIDPNRVAILNPEPHAAHIEFGVRAENVKIGRALIRALAEWALRKGLARDEDDATSMAWGIAKNMQRRGIFNNHSSKGGLRILEELNTRHIDRILSEEVHAEIRRRMGTLT